MSTLLAPSLFHKTISLSRSSEETQGEGNFTSTVPSNLTTKIWFLIKAHHVQNTSIRYVCSVLPSILKACCMSRNVYWAQDIYIFHYRLIRLTPISIYKHSTSKFCMLISNLSKYQKGARHCYGYIKLYKMATSKRPRPSTGFYKALNFLSSAELYEHNIIPKKPRLQVSDDLPQECTKWRGWLLNVQQYYIIVHQFCVFM